MFIHRMGCSAVAVGVMAVGVCVAPAAADLTFNVSNSGVQLAGVNEPSATFIITPLSDGIGFDGSAGPYTHAAWNTALNGSDPFTFGLIFSSQGTFSGPVPAGSLFQMNWLFGLTFDEGEVHFSVTSTMRARRNDDNTLVQRVRRIDGIATASGMFSSSNDLVPAVPVDCTGDNWNLFLEVFWTPTQSGPAIGDDATLSVLVPANAHINLILPTGNVPTPGGAGLLVLGGLVAGRRRR
ncbi:MAG: hypothetical protein ACREJO_11320 [Phycisphaerales bacterium]